MKLEKCPECGGNLETTMSLRKERKHIQSCRNCMWKGEAYVPEMKPIPTTKKINVGVYTGFHYEIFDCYGEIIISSSYYDTQEEAVQSMSRYVKKLSVYYEMKITGVLWPREIEVSCLEIMESVEKQGE